MVFDKVRYNQGNIAETVFSAVKRKFGDTLRARKYRNQIKEIKIKLIVYNMDKKIVETICIKLSISTEPENLVFKKFDPLSSPYVENRNDPNPLTEKVENPYLPEQARSSNRIENSMRSRENYEAQNQDSFNFLCFPYYFSLPLYRRMPEAK